MITLITIFYTFIFSFDGSPKPDCQDKLAELNYVYEYDREPAICQYDFCDVRLRECHNGVDTNTVKEIKSIYNCFKEVEKILADKVILISYQSLLDTAHINTIEILKDEELGIRKYAVIKRYNLFDNNVYFQNNPNQQKAARIELIDTNHNRLKNLEKYIRPTFHCEPCPACPF